MTKAAWANPAQVDIGEVTARPVGVLVVEAALDPDRRDGLWPDQRSWSALCRGWSDRPSLVINRSTVHLYLDALTVQG